MISTFKVSELFNSCILVASYCLSIYFQDLRLLGENGSQLELDIEEVRSYHEAREKDFK